MKEKEDDWLYEIIATQSVLHIDLKEIWRYRDLLVLFVRRDIVATYKQTILGPLWFLIQPLFTSIIFTLVFNNIASISTGTVPPFLFNLAGITLWNFFKDCLTESSNTFTTNATLFSKVYFPRVIVPLSQSISGLVKLGIQFFIFIVFYLYFVIKGAILRPDELLWTAPILVVIIAVLGLGSGMFISSLTTKYRDFKILIGFAVSLFMYVSAVMYPLAEVKTSETLSTYSWVVEYNPIAILIENFRFITLGEGLFSWSMLGYCTLFSSVIFVVGLIMFNKTGRSFIDTV